MDKDINSGMLAKFCSQTEFVNLVQLCKNGLALFDRDLRYFQVNEHMGAINIPSIKEHPGRTTLQVDPSIAAALEPFIKQVFETGMPLVDLEVAVPAPSGTGLPEKNYWIFSCYPFTSEAGEFKKVGVVIRDITEQRLKDAAQEDHLKFEALLSDLSAAFINVHVNEVDKKIESGLQKIVEFLQFDRCTIWNVSQEDDGQSHVTHSYERPGIAHPPTVIQHVLPAWHSIWKKGELLMISDVEKLSDDAWREKKYCKDLGGIRSIFFLPQRVGGVLVGLLTMVSLRVTKVWPDLLIQRIRLLSEIIENTLERKRADQKNQKAMEEIEELKNRLAAENLYLRDQIEVEQKYEEIVGESSAIKKVLLQVEQVAKTDSTVLILGETGTGKELIARAIHKQSGRNDRTMIKLNCAALPATLIEAELFGREKGAYTGASATQIGRFEAANGSSIFLDEIGELPMELQSKLLRVLQEGQFERLGSTTPINVDVRIIAATNRNLLQAVLEGKFRQDLYYRLNVFPIFVPPLRERSEDIPLLVWAMIREFEKTFGKSIERIPKKNMDDLERFPWPGNIRELRNIMERAMIVCNSSTLVAELPGSQVMKSSQANSLDVERQPKKNMDDSERSSWPENIRELRNTIERAMIICNSSTLLTELPVDPTTKNSQSNTLEDVEREHIISVLESTDWRVRGKGGAAEIMNLKPTTLDSKMKRLGIKRIYIPQRIQ